MKVTVADPDVIAERDYRAGMHGPGGVGTGDVVGDGIDAEQFPALSEHPHGVRPVVDVSDRRGDGNGLLALPRDRVPPLDGDGRCQAAQPDGTEAKRHRLWHLVQGNLVDDVACRQVPPDKALEPLVRTLPKGTVDHPERVWQVLVAIRVMQLESDGVRGRVDLEQV